MANNDKSTKDQKDEVEVQDISFVEALFDDPDAAKAAYKALKDGHREGIYTILAAAYMEKSERSKIKIHEYKDWSGKKGLLAGGAAGAVVGIVGSAVLLPVAAGALIGGVVSKIHDKRFNNDDLKEAAKLLPVGSSALVAIVEDTYVMALEDELTEVGGKNIHSGELPTSTLLSITQITQMTTPS